MGLVEAWVASTVLGICVGAAWLVPRMGLGRQPALHPRRRAGVILLGFRRRRRRRSRHRRSLAAPSAGSVGHWLGQHLTSAGGILIPLVLPILVVFRLGVTQNAYFYITEMMGAAFFMVSPSVASAVFAEGVRAHSDLRRLVGRALRVIAVLLTPAIAVMIVGGKVILGLFGTSYATAGYKLLILLAIAALPDAISNVAVVICRVRRRLGYSTILNLGILVMTLAGAWILMPKLGIAGVGVAWLAAQTLGAIASLPAYAHIREPIAAAAVPGRGDNLVKNMNFDPGVDLLIDLARRQALDRFRGLVP
jgi:O-antigen/teichoic acid export membrane protein